MSFEQDEEDQFGQSYEDNKEFEFNGSGFGDEEINPHSPLDDSDKPRIILMGLRRSGKSSIEKVVFQKMSPNETLFLESTNKIVKQEVANSSFVQFQIWDFPGQIDLFDGSIDYNQIFGGCGALIFVIDAQDDYMEALNKLNTTVVKAYKINSSIKFIVFIHKVDGLNEDTKMETQRDIHQRATDDLRDAFGNVPGFDKIHLSFHLTSIYDHSIFEAFSKVVQKLIPQLATLENLLNIIISNSGIEKAFLFDVISKIYVATDCSPVDMQSYELCCDMIDVVIDIASIYGSEESESGAFDENTSSLIKLNNGTVLYLREVNKFLALVCILREDNFDKQGDKFERMESVGSEYAPLQDSTQDATGFSSILSPDFDPDLDKSHWPNFVQVGFQRSRFPFASSVIDYNFLCFRNAIHKLYAMKKEDFLENGPPESNS